MNSFQQNYILIKFHDSVSIPVCDCSILAIFPIEFNAFTLETVLRAVMSINNQVTFVMNVAAAFIWLVNIVISFDIITIDRQKILVHM